MKKEKALFLSKLSVGLGVTMLIVGIMKWLVWAKIAENYSYLESLGLMFLSIVFVRYLLLLLYDFIKIDFFDLEKYKSGREYNENHITRKIEKIKIISKKIAIISMLSMSLDITIAVIYFRPGYFKYNGFQNLETIFIFFLGNLWTVISWGNFIELIF